MNYRARFTLIALSLMLLSPAQAFAEAAEHSRVVRPHHVYIGTGGLFVPFLAGYQYAPLPQLSIGAAMGPNLWGEAMKVEHPGVIVSPTLRYYFTEHKDAFYTEANTDLLIGPDFRLFSVGLLLGYEFRSQDAGVFNLSAGLDVSKLFTSPNSFWALPLLKLTYGWAF